MKEQIYLVLLPTILEALREVAKEDKAKAWECTEMLAKYMEDGIPPTNTDFTSKMVFIACKGLIDGCKETYNRNRANGKKGGRPKATKVEAQVQTEVQNESDTEAQVQTLSNQENAKLWDDLSKATDIPKEELFEYKEQFEAQCRVSGKIHESFDDKKKHFLSWVLIQKKNKTHKSEKGREERKQEFIQHVIKRFRTPETEDEVPEALKNM